MAADLIFPTGPEQEAVIDLLEERIRFSTVGFLKLNPDAKTRDVKPAGTGTLVSVDSILGILTAAHVLAELPDSGLSAWCAFETSRRRTPPSL